MSALMTRRRRSPARDRDTEYSQASLFGQVVSPPPLAPAEPVEAPAPARDHDHDHRDEARAAAELTLEAAITAIWDDLTTGATTDCPVCGAEMQPRHSAGAGVVGGRCTSCGTTLA
jgi:hypothetical protein